MEGVGAGEAREKGTAMPSPIPASPRPLLMASEAIAWIASALRCAAVRGGSDAISESTAKRVAGASAYVSAEKTTALLNNLLDALFTEAYLRGHGLDVRQAADHRALLVAGIEGALAVWDRFAAIGNACDREERAMVIPMLGAMLLTDLSARVAAYLVRYGRVVPALRRLLDPQPALTFARALQRIRARALRTISNAELLRASRRGKSKVDRNTLRDLMGGKRLPREETILLLAHGLASFGVREADGRDATAHATLFSELGEALRADRDVHDEIAGQHRTICFFAWDLRRYGATDLAEIVVLGTRWPKWSEVHKRFSHVIENDLFNIARGLHADAERQAREVDSRSHSNPSAGFEMMAAHYRSLAAMTRTRGGEVPGGERSTAGDLVRFFGQAAELFAALAAGREPLKYEGLGDTFRAKCLCDHALAPWNEFTPAQQQTLYEQAVELDPACAYVRLRYAEFLLRQGDRIAEAERHLDDAVMLDEAYDDARSLLAEVLLRRDRPQAAVAHIDALEARLGATAMVLVLRGFARLAFGETAAAAEVFARALDIAPRDVAAHLGMARAQRALGDASRARKHEQFAELFAGERSPRPTSVA
jgi:tetratricopeptide (TPR) repeat protein